MSDALYTDPWVTVDTIPVTSPTGGIYDHRRVTSGTGNGAVLVPVVVHRGLTYVGCLRIHRPVVDFTAIELPRGGTRDQGDAEAIREFREETGLQVSSVERVGELFPDTGLLTTKVGVWVVHCAAPDGVFDPKNPPRFTDPETGSELVWLDAVRVDYPQVRCGITLAAMRMVEPRLVRSI